MAIRLWRATPILLKSEADRILARDRQFPGRIRGSRDQTFTHPGGDLPRAAY